MTKIEIKKIENKILCNKKTSPSHKKKINRNFKYYY